VHYLRPGSCPLECPKISSEEDWWSENNFFGLHTSQTDRFHCHSKKKEISETESIAPGKNSSGRLQLYVQPNSFELAEAIWKFAKKKLGTPLANPFQISGISTLW